MGVAGVIVIFGTFPAIAVPALAAVMAMAVNRIAPIIHFLISDWFIIDFTPFSATLPPSYFPAGNPGIAERGRGHFINLCKHETQPDLHGEGITARAVPHLRVCRIFLTRKDNNAAKESRIYPSIIFAWPCHILRDAEWFRHRPFHLQTLFFQMIKDIRIISGKQDSYLRV
jgi:hypothetical protein